MADLAPKSKLHTHPLPQVDPDFCSCCRKSIIHKGPQKQNVVRIDLAPERILGLDGKERGVEGKMRPKAFFHAVCFQDYHSYTPGRIECKYCGVLSMAKTMHDGTKVKEQCKCSCHTGATFCSLVVF